MFLQQHDAFVVTIVQQPEKQETIVDLLLGSLGLTILAVLAGILLGGLLGFVLVQWHRRRPPGSGHLPPISPFVPDSTRPPSSPTR
jgi:ABC-type phosphate transport system permease subunit